MPLWEVDVAGVSRRFVDADDATSAVAAVRDSLIASMTLSVRRAPADLDRQYEERGPLQRKRMLAGLDSLAGRRTAGQMEADIERLQAQLARQRTWREDQLEGCPPADPERVQRILTMIELDHVRSNLRRLERRDPRPDADYF